MWQKISNVDRFKFFINLITLEAILESFSNEMQQTVVQQMKFSHLEAQAQPSLVFDRHSYI